MSDTKEKFSGITVALHWLLALAIVGALIYGLWIDTLPKGDLKAFHIRNHKSMGMIILAFAVFRILWRLLQGLPKQLRSAPAWERTVQVSTQLLLLAATVAVPLSGIYFSAMGGHAVSVFGFEVVPQFIAKESIDKVAADRAFAIHSTLAWLLIALIGLHVLGAVKHVVVSKDGGTLRRMLGARVT